MLGSSSNRTVKFICDSKNDVTFADPSKFAGDIENYLGLKLPARNGQRSLQILKALESKQIKEEKIGKLREKFCNVLAIGNARS